MKIRIKVFKLLRLKIVIVKNAIKHFPAEGEATLSGIIIEADHETGLAKKITRLIEGGSLIK